MSNLYIAGLALAAVLILLVPLVTWLENRREERLWRAEVRRAERLARSAEARRRIRLNSMPQAPDNAIVFDPWSRRV